MSSLVQAQPLIGSPGDGDPEPGRGEGVRDLPTQAGTTAGDHCYLHAVLLMT